MATMTIEEIKTKFVAGDIDEKEAFSKFASVPVKEFQDKKSVLSPEDVKALFDKSEDPENIAVILTLIEQTYETESEAQFSDLSGMVKKIDKVNKKKGSTVTWDKVFTVIPLLAHQLFMKSTDEERLTICKGVSREVFISKIQPIIQSENMDVLTVNLIDESVVSEEDFTDTFLERHNIYERSAKLYEAQTGEKAIRINDGKSTKTEEIDLF